MTDTTDSAASGADAPATARATTAGGLLRQARQAQGLHIAALAAAIKVVPRKLELLEADQFDQLPDATFTRALAQTVCRQLKIDPAPVLALLPPAQHAYRLEQVAEGLKTPFHEHHGGMAPRSWAAVASPVLWIAALIVVLTVAVYLVPARWLPFGIGGGQRLRAADAAASDADAGNPGAASSTTTTVLAAAPAGSGSESAPGDAASSPAADAAAAVAVAPDAAASTSADAAAVPVPAASTAASAAAATAGAATAAAGSGVLQIHATAASWVGVTDGRGQSRLSRVVQAGESVPIDGPAPFKLTIGNAVGTQVVFKGQPLALAAYTRDNVARLELK